MGQWSGVDWVGLWKIYRYWFVVLYAVISLPCKFWLFRNLTRGINLRSGSWSVVSSVACPAFNVWLPLLPALGIGVINAVTGRNDVGQSIRVGVPVVAILMGFQAAALDAALVRLASRSGGEPRTWHYVVGCNVGAALVTVGSALWWIAHHPPNIIA